MGLAYGIPFTPAAIDAAEQKARQYDAAPDTDVLFRVEAVRYAGCSLTVSGCEEYYTTDARLELFAFTVRRWTEHGATIAHYSGARRKWCDLRDDAKQWASRTPAEALRQFAERRRRQIYILERQLRRARAELALTEESPCPAPIITSTTRTPRNGCAI